MVTSLNGLILNGGLGAGAGLELYAENSTTPFDIPGTYHLIHYAGSIQGPNGIASLLVLDPQPGFSYSFSNNLSLSDVDLTITSVPEPSTLILAIGGVLISAIRLKRRRGRSALDGSASIAALSPTAASRSKGYLAAG